MKKTLLILRLTIITFIITPVFSYAENWVSTNQATVAWDAVSTLNDGSSVPVTDVIRYNVFIRDRKSGVTTEVAHEILETRYTISFDPEGFWHIGAQAVRYVSVDGLIPSGDEPLMSEIIWSDVAENCADGVTFGIRHHIPPGKVRNIRSE